MVKLDDKSVVLLGGYINAWNDYNRDIWIWSNNSESTMAWRRTGTMLSNRNEFACGKIYDSAPELYSTFYIVLNGGNPATSTTELLKMQDQNASSEWQTGPEFPYKVYASATATSLDGKKLIVAGGQSGDGNYLSSIFQLQCWNQICEWSLMEQALRIPRYRSVAIIG